MKPLDGMFVLDLSRLLPGPFCSWLLRSWGARVVKVEDVQVGDYLREAQPLWFQHLNAGAESIALDLKRPAGREAFLRLAARANVVLEGFRPGVMERLGLGYEVLRAANPKVVLTSISAYDGERADRAGHDLNCLALSGLLSLMTEMPPVQLADLTGGMFAAAGTLAAVVHAQASGQGAHVQTTMLDALFALGSLQAVETQAGVELSRAVMPLAGGLASYHVYETADGGRFTLGMVEFKFWQGFCHMMKRPDWAERHLDPTLKPELERLFRSRPLAEWAELARQHDLCLEPVLTMAEALGDRQNFQPVRFAGERPGCDSSMPARGAHSHQLLREAGLSEQEILGLAAEGVVKSNER